MAHVRTRERERQHESALQRARDRVLVARADCLRDDRVERHERALPEDPGNEEVEIAERRRRRAPLATRGRP